MEITISSIRPKSLSNYVQTLLCDNVSVVEIPAASSEFDWTSKKLNYFTVFEKGSWQLLEPIMNVEVVVPTEFQGNIMGIVTRRSGLITSIEGTEHYGTITADVSIVEASGFLLYVLLLVRSIGFRNGKITSS